MQMQKKSACAHAHINGQTRVHLCTHSWVVVSKGKEDVEFLR